MDPSAAQSLPEFKKVKNSDGSETIHYASFSRVTPNDCETLAEQKFGETQEKVSRGVESLKKFSEDKGLPQTEDVYLLAVLRNSKYDLKKSQAKLEKFLRAKEMIEEKVAGVDLDSMNVLLNDTCFTILPYRDKHGRLILMTQPTVNLDAYSLNDALFCGMALFLYILTYTTTSLHGIVYIGLTKTHSVSLMYQILMALKSISQTLFDLPISLQKVEVTHANVLVRWFVNVSRHIIPAKVYKRISIHSDNFEKLKKTYHPDLLPEELGGNLGPLSNRHMKNELLDFLRKLREEHRTKIAAEN